MGGPLPMTETTLYDENNLSGLGKEVVAEIEVEIDYKYNSGYPATYMEPGTEDEIEITGCWPTGITIEPTDIPESNESVLFIRLMNLFVQNHRTCTFKPEQLDPERRSRLDEFCADSADHENITDAAKRDAEDRYYDYPDQD
jgi:hypothetical protein